MKNVIISAGLVLVIIISAFIALTIYGHNSRQNEVEEALTVAVEQALSNLAISKQYSAEEIGTEEFLADFTQRLVLGIDSNSNIVVNILAVDTEKGLLDVEVVERYRQLDGSIGTASYRKTVILEEVYEFAVEYCTVTFKKELGFGSGDFVTYKEFTIADGSDIIFPGATPKLSDEYSFVGWSLEAPAADNEYSPEIYNGTKVDGDMELYAVFEPVNAG